MARTFICTKTEPVVTTKAGKLRGFKLDSTYTFYGIKYADAGRFQRPHPVKSWDGIKDALSYGMVSPMLSQDHPNGEAMVPHRYWPMDENCQYLNVWTQSLDSKSKKPVMVWLHGGGFAAGSSIEQQAYDGDSMSRNGDVVVVSLNHRLNIIGYMDLSSFGEKYKNSGNAGNLDIVEALKWIHENIEQFGGDPDNVTIFGQSGGGMKVWTLMQTPEADGLFHKGIVESGLLSGFDLYESGDGREIVTALMKELGITEIEKLETVPYAELAAAYNKVSPALARAGKYVGGNPLKDDSYLGDPRYNGFTEHAKTIPVMVGTVFGEFAFMPGPDNKKSISEEAATEMADKRFSGNGKKLMELFRKAYPDKDPADLMVLDTLFRAPTKDFIALKSKSQESATYSYMFNFEFPYDGGKPAWHCSEIPFVFHNADIIPICNLPGVSDELQEQVFSAWINFARTGNPSSDILPEWQACKDGDEACMLFDRKCELKHNHDNELQEILRKVTPPFSFAAVENVQH